MYWRSIRLRLVGRSVPLLMAAVLLALGCTATPRPVTPSEAPAPDIAQFWAEPAGLERRDLFLGPGGESLMPDAGATFTLIERDASGFSPGYSVRDVPGMKWNVKSGPEAQSEVVASRITWALGYHQPAMYYVGRWRLIGDDIPPDAAPAGRFRPERPGWRRHGGWSWARNPFVGTQPYRGLIVLMHVLNNWDLLDRNTAMYQVDTPVAGARMLYVVHDLGASLGRTMIAKPSGSRNDVDDFERQGFIKGVDKDGIVRFEDTQWRHEKLHGAITPVDVRWTCERLHRLTPQQWADAFRAADYEPSIADRFVRRLREKVAMGLALGGGAPAPGERAAAGAAR